MTGPPASEWVTVVGSPGERLYIENLDGVWWHDAPLPRKWHRCTPQTRGCTDWLSRVYRCACGAASLNPAGGKHYWINKNERRR
jgi:hypothetical protein